jgi:hypothetical protein
MQGRTCSRLNRACGAHSFYHLVRTYQYSRRHVEAEGHSQYAGSAQSRFTGGLYGQVSRLLAGQDAVDVGRLPDRSIGVDEAFAEFVQCRTAMEDEIVAELDLREEQAMLAAGLLSHFCSEERGERASHFWRRSTGPKGRASPRAPAAFGFRACDEGIRTLLEVDAFRAHAVGEPVMLIEADAGGEQKIGTDAHEHPSPLPVIDIEVVLDDPAVRDRKMPSVRLAVARSPS